MAWKPQCSSSVIHLCDKCWWKTGTRTATIATETAAIATATASTQKNCSICWACSRPPSMPSTSSSHPFRWVVLLFACYMPDNNICVCRPKRQKFNIFSSLSWCVYARATFDSLNECCTVCVAYTEPMIPNAIQAKGQTAHDCDGWRQW